MSSIGVITSVSTFSQHQRSGNAGQGGEFFHDFSMSRRYNFRTSVICPVIAAAAAIAGLAKCVRDWGPWRPTKLRFEVETQRSPGATLSPFHATHSEQPGSPPRHACLAEKPDPALRPRPWRLTACDPGTTQAVTCAATCCPFTIPAAARRSLIRLLVHEPINTRSMRRPSSGVPGCKSTYWRAACMDLRASSVAAWAGSGTSPSILTVCSGLVPQLICGAIRLASIDISASKVAWASDASIFQSTTAASHTPPCGANGRPATYSKVVSSGADLAKLGAQLNRHIAQGHPAFHAKRSNSSAGELDGIATAGSRTNCADDRQNEIFRLHAPGRTPHHT